jgi:hypothetical protein
LDCATTTASNAGLLRLRLLLLESEAYLDVGRAAAIADRCHQRVHTLWLHLAAEGT